MPLQGHTESPVISRRSFGEITGEPIRHGEVGPLRLTYEGKKFLQLLHDALLLLKRGKG